MVFVMTIAQVLVDLEKTRAPHPSQASRVLSFQASIFSQLLSISVPVKYQVTGRTAADVRGVPAHLTIARGDDRIFAGRQFYVHQWTGVVQRQHGLTLGFLDNHTHIRNVFIP
jgi:hypothetical protein